jgi:hypothetical protein
MDIFKILEELRQERQQLDEAIVVLERLVSSGGGKRRGRPPAWLKRAGAAVGASTVPVGKVSSRKKFSAETRKKMAEAQKKRWDARQKEEHS